MEVRRRQSFTATLTMPGYLPATIKVGPTVNLEGGAAFLGNAVVGGLIGATVDVWTGAPLDPTPNGTVVTLMSDPAALHFMSADEGPGCSREKFLYALRVGVPCSSLGDRFDLRTLRLTGQ